MGCQVTGVFQFTGDSDSVIIKAPSEDTDLLLGSKKKKRTNMNMQQKL